MTRSSNEELPNANSKKGRCTRCRAVAVFTVGETEILSEYSLGGRDVRELANALTCHGCNGKMIVVSRETWAQEGMGVESEEFVLYFPALGAGILDISVPEKIASCFDEGQRCLSVSAFRAAVVMYRGALAEFVVDKGSEKAAGQNALFDRLKVMAEEDDLHPTIIEWAGSIRVLGNEGGHPEKYDPVAKDEAHEIGNLTRYLIEIHYEMPARLARARGKTSLPEGK